MAMMTGDSFKTLRRIAAVGVAACVLSVAVVRQTAAQDKPADATPPPPDPDKVTLNFFKNTEIGGLVDAYWLYNSNKVPPSYQAFDVLYNSFDVSMAEFWVAKTPTADSPIGYKIRTTFGSAADIMASASGQFLKESPYKNIEEAFGSYLAPVGKGLQIDVGKFVTNAGAEVIEAKDDLNYSRSLLFQLAIPLYHSGVRLDVLSERQGHADGRGDQRLERRERQQHGEVRHGLGHVQAERLPEHHRELHRRTRTAQQQRRLADPVGHRHQLHGQSAAEPDGELRLRPRHERS